MKRARRSALVLSLLLATSCARTHVPPPPVFGFDAEAGIDAHMQDASEPDADQPAPTGLRNVIVFLGDGMGPEHLATGRYPVGTRLRIDALHGPSLVNTDSLTTLRIGGGNPPATDSAAAATAIAAGMLVENGVLSQTPDGQPMPTVLEAFKRTGRRTGVVTTSYFFDATPAAFASHQPSRGRYAEIAHEMIDVTQPEVIMGAGGWLVDDAQSGVRDSIDSAGYTLVRSLDALLAWDPSASTRVFGLFSTNFVPAVTASESFTMTPALERTNNSADPPLAVMTERAIDLLSQGSGFFLLAEDELFDEMSHRGPAEVAWANRALPAQVAAFDAAVGVAIDWVLRRSSFEETLIVVLADHETGGYHFDHGIGPETGDFSAFSDNGVLRSGFHTRTPIAVYALGPGSERLAGAASLADVHRLLLQNLP